MEIPFRRSANMLLKSAEYDKEKGEIRIAGDDWIMMSSAMLRDLVIGTEKMLGSGAIPLWLELGKNAGREFSKRFVKLGFELVELTTMLKNFFTEGGWGKMQGNVNFKEKEALVTLENSAIARQINATEPVCHFIRGFVAGVFDVMFNEFTECLETQCIGKGDAYCEFRVKRKTS